MIDTKNMEEMSGKKSGFGKVSGSAEPIYGLGILGALYYYLIGAHTFTEIILGIFKSILWPGVIVFNVLKYFGW